MSYSFHNKIYKTKSKLTNHFKYILSRSKLNTPINYKEELLELLQYHPRTKQVIGKGIKHFEVQRLINPYTNRLSRTREFVAIRDDNSSFPFSFQECIKNIEVKKKNNKEQDIKKAFRFEIRHFIQQYKSNYFGSYKTGKCQGTNKRIYKRNSEVDHIYPLTFEQLVFNFLREFNYKFKDINLKRLNDDYLEIKNKEVAKQWFDYHSQYAQLRVVGKKFNRRQPKAKGLDWSLFK